jgi:hypothetical protein
VPLYAPRLQSTFVEPRDFERDLDQHRRVARTKIWAAVGGRCFVRGVCDFRDRRGVARGRRGEVRTNGQALMAYL